MKKIGQLNVMGHTWKVYLSDDLPLEIDGVTIFASKRIEISSRLKGDALTVCWVHEFGHVVLHELGMYLTGFSPEIEELVVDAYAKAFSKNYKEFKKIVK